MAKGKRKNVHVISDAEARKMIEKAMRAGWLLWIKCNAWGNRKKLARDLLEEKFREDAEAISATQRLLDPEAVRRVTSPMDAIQREARAISKPWFHDGVYYIEQQDMERMEGRLREAMAEKDRGLDELVEGYEALKKAEKMERPNLYKEENYPVAETFGSRFRLTWGWQRITLPAGKEDISIVGKDVVTRENAKFREMMKEAAEQGIAAMRKSFLEIIEHLRDSLRDGTKFQESTVEKPKEFLKRLSSTMDGSIYSDKPFKDMAQDIEEILDGVHAEDLRRDEVYRGAVGNAMDDVVGAFKSLPTVELERAVEF